MRLNRPFIIQCKNCKDIIEIDMDVEAVDFYERSMGTEIEFEGDIEDRCPCCGNSIQIKISVWEYPVGAVNYQSETIEGAVILEDPEFDPFG